jgi:hypothetical protein
MSGGGKAWLKDQEAIYRHAKGLGIIDVPHPWGDDRKQGTEDDLTKSQWSNFTDRLNAAKSGGWSPNAGQSERSSDWYRTSEGADYAASLGKPVGFGINAAFPVEGSGGESSVGSGSPTNPGTGIGPYPLDNMYFPQLTHAYETPQAQDWSQYGLLHPNYQPWTEQGGQQFVPENIWNYAPPQINRQPVQYGGPPMGGLMEVIMPAEESDEDPNKMTPQEMIESGLYDGNPDTPSYDGYDGFSPGFGGWPGNTAAEGERPDFGPGSDKAAQGKVSASNIGKALGLPGS